MSKTNFTPGPWRRGRVGSVVSDHPVPEVDGTDHVAYYGGHCICESVSVVNAHLIAAAPEMYEALEQLLPHAERMSSSDFIEYGKTDWMSVAIKEARAVLAKARGEK